MDLTIKDENPGGKLLGELVLLSVPTDISVRDLIRLRVREEVVKYNLQPKERFQGLVRPTGAEEDLNGYRLRRPRIIDWERQADAAEKSFSQNGFLILVGNRQVESLDERLALDEASDVAFVRLVPLTGG